MSEENYQNKTNLNIQKIETNISHIKEYLVKINGEQKEINEKFIKLIQKNEQSINELKIEDIKISDQVKIYRVIVPLMTAIIGALSMFILTNILQ